MEAHVNHNGHVRLYGLSLLSLKFALKLVKILHVLMPTSLPL